MLSRLVPGWLMPRLRERQDARALCDVLDQAWRAKVDALATRADSAERVQLLIELSRDLDGLGEVYALGYGKRGGGRALGFREGARLVFLVAEAEAARAAGRMRQLSPWTEAEEAGRLSLNALADPRASELRRRGMVEAFRLDVAPYLRGEGGDEVLEGLARGFSRLALRTRRS